MWTLWRREKSLTPAGNLTAIPWLCSPKPSHYTKYAMSAAVLVFMCGGKSVDSVAVLRFALIKWK
jgi:hypothetical protein